ncbi:MAG: hypothetical protein VX730_03815 [Pseudomonadota bacterium]|nr:hypothetical protein [Pseudomonadota bacterium]
MLSQLNSLTLNQKIAVSATAIAASIFLITAVCFPVKAVEALQFTAWVVLIFLAFVCNIAQGLKDRNTLGELTKIGGGTDFNPWNYLLALQALITMVLGICTFLAFSEGLQTVLQMGWMTTGTVWLVTALYSFGVQVPRWLSKTPING